MRRARAACIGGGVALLAAAWVAPAAWGERLSASDFGPAATDAWAYTIEYPDAADHPLARADEATAPRLDDGRWRLRLGSAPSRVRFETVPLGAHRHSGLSWVFRVERARWTDDAFFEVRARAPGGEEALLWRWGAAELRSAKPGRGHYQHALLPPGWSAAEVEISARATASRGAAWFDLHDLRIDGVPRAAPDGVAPAFERPPYLQLVSSETAVVRFRSRYPRRAALRWTQAAEGHALPREDSGWRRWQSEGREVEHEVVLAALQPNTPVSYEVDLDGVAVAAGPDFRFHTAPAGREMPSEGIGIWVLGDSGLCSASDEGCTWARAVRDAFASHVPHAGADASRDQAPAALWFLLGDNAYPHGTDWQLSQALFQMYPRRAAATPLWPVPGNHDFPSADSTSQQGPYYEAFTLPSAAEAGGVPSGTEAYYAFDWGPLHVVALDSHDTDRSADGAMARWLERDLAAAADAAWKIAVFHHPPYSHGSHNSDASDDSGGRMIEMREVFVPILEAHGVDLVLSGHSHGYERSSLIRGHTGHSSTYQEALHQVAGGDGAPGRPYQKRGDTGTLYAVVGSSSEASRRMKRHPVMVRSLPVLGSLWIELDAVSLRGRFIGADAQILDAFEIQKHPVAGAPGPVAWTLSAVLVLTAALAALWAGRRRH